MVYIEEIIRKMEQGRTQPYLCKDSDKNSYVIKRAAATFIGCIKELICAHLAEKFGLPVPEFCLAEIDELLLEYNNDHRFDLGDGVGFASRFVPDLQEVNYSLLDEVQIAILKDLFVFDYWIKNGDRTLSEQGGNPNLFYKQSTCEIIVVDHNLAFDNDFDIDNHKSIHVSARFWHEHQGLFDHNDYKERMQNALISWGDILKEIPDDWKNNIPEIDDFLRHLRLILEGYNNDDFWEALK